jgi:mannose-6-phosphate isomerase-like protein (cupin superfamily)
MVLLFDFAGGGALVPEEVRRAETPETMELWEEPDAYYAWQKAEGVPVIVDYAFEDMNEIPLGNWERKGGRGAIINIPNPALPNDCHVVEIAPGGKSEPEHHMYEEVMYVVSGRGATSVWTDEKNKVTFEWAPGSMVSIPMNATYQHFNGSGSQPARYVSMTNAPPVMRMFKSTDFIFNNPFHFTDRFGGEGDESYFSGQGQVYRRKGSKFGTMWKSNFIPNVDTMPLWDYKDRGAGGVNTHFDMAGNITKSHVSEFPVGTYKKGHRHGPGAHLVICGGVGFSVLWWEGKPYKKVNWKKGSLVIVPEEGTFHQHFNTGKEPARYLALRAPNGTPDKYGESNVSMKEGGMQIEYEDEDPEIHKMFEADLAAHGAPCRMKAFIPWCTGEVGPTNERDT